MNFEIFISERNKEKEKNRERKRSMKLDRAAGWTHQRIANKHNLSKSRVSFILKKKLFDVRADKARWAREWRQRNPEKAKVLDKKWSEKYKEKRLAYAQENKENHAIYEREKYHRVEGMREKSTVRARERYQSRERTPREKVNQSLSSNIRDALNGKKAGRRWEALVGYTMDDLFKHLELLFDENMSWENYGSYWAIDHIKPKSLFKYKTAKDNEFKKCWALNNLQPMEKIANIRKGNKYEK